LDRKRKYYMAMNIAVPDDGRVHEKNYKDLDAPGIVK